MEYTLKVAAVNGDVVPLGAVAVALAQAKATAFGTEEFHLARFKFNYREYISELLAEVMADNLKVCDHRGQPKDWYDITRAAHRNGTLSIVRRYATEPDWEKLQQETPRLVEGVDVWDFSNVDLGPAEPDDDATCLLALHVKLSFLNAWGRVRGDEFRISSEGVEWLEGWGDLGALQVSVFGTAREPGVTAATVRPVPRERAQDMAIREMLVSRGYVLKALPPFENGKRGVKAEIRAELMKDTALFSTARVFGTAWQRLLDDEKHGIAYAS
ncbi:MAG: hypothetical protein V4723_03095 [Pseudomonadota bacterium]